MPAAGRTCGHDAGPTWCTDPVLARGLCRRHYRRAAKGLPLDPDDGRQVGTTPSGHGVWGVLTTDGERLLCHECGAWFQALGVHVGMVHDGARAYRLAHGLTLATPLTGPELHAARSARARATGLERQVADRRSPHTLALADPEMIDRGLRLAGRRGPGPTNP